MYNNVFNIKLLMVLAPYIWMITHNLQVKLSLTLMTIFLKIFFAHNICTKIMQNLYINENVFIKV